VGLGVGCELLLLFCGGYSRRGRGGREGSGFDYLWGGLEGLGTEIGRWDLGCVFPKLF